MEFEIYGVLNKNKNVVLRTLRMRSTPFSYLVK